MGVQSANEVSCGRRSWMDLHANLCACHNLQSFHTWNCGTSVLWCYSVLPIIQVLSNFGTWMRLILIIQSISLIYICIYIYTYIYFVHWQCAWELSILVVCIRFWSFCLFGSVYFCPRFCPQQSSSVSSVVVLPFLRSTFGLRLLEEEWRFHRTWVERSRLIYKQ